MQISNYIIELLYRYDCVIIPEFGAFISKRIPAKLLTEQQIIVPPKKQLLFNEQITNNDGLLTNYICTKEKIDYSTATIAVKKFVANLQEEIVEHSSFNFPKIGSFSTNAEGNLIFSPNKENNYLREAFGLETVVTTTIERAPVIVEVAENETLEESNTPTTLVASSRNTYTGAKYAASLALLVGFGGYLFWNQNKLVEAEKYTETSRRVQQRIQEASFVIDITNPLPSISLNVTPELVEEKTKPYHIIAGAFRDQDNANKLIKRLKRKGFKANYLGTNKFGLHQVAYDSFENKVEAVRFLSKIKRKENKTAWILSK